MDTHITIDGLEFEWDENKNQTNRQLHHVTFKQAARVFFDENRLERPNEAHSLDEERYISLGWADGILFVVHTERSDVIRIISARPATPYERRLYYEREDYQDTLDRALATADDGRKARARHRSALADLRNRSGLSVVNPGAAKEIQASPSPASGSRMIFTLTPGSGRGFFLPQQLMNLPK